MEKYDKIEEMIISGGDIINPVLHLQERIISAQKTRSNNAETEKYTDVLRQKRLETTN